MMLPEIASCMHGSVHWFSQQVLDYYLTGRVSTGEFLRWFHMPNSDYLSISECIVHRLDPHYDPTQWSPGLLDGYLPPHHCPPHTPGCLT